MQIASKGQVAIPREIRNQLGLLPHTKVEFELAGDHARMSTDEILALTRGDTHTTKRRRK
jgi:AbrB family looped-hinge helix DNA binding protein